MSNQTTTANAAGTPAEAPAAPGGAIYIQLLCIVLFWGSNWPLMKIALGDIGPISLTAVRLAGASLVLAALAAVLRFPLLPVRGERALLTAVGLLQVAGFMAFSNFGLQFVPPGRAAVLAYTMQMWALPLGLLLLGERASVRKIAGALLTFAGVMTFFNPLLVDWSDGRAMLGNGLMVCCALCWALGATLYRRRTLRTPFWTQTFWQLAVSTVVLAPLAFAMEGTHPIHWTAPLLGILVYNWVVTTGLGYWWWSRVLAVMPASQAGQIVCLVPVTALILSLFLNGERLTLDIVVGFALIGSGIVLTARGR